MKTLRTNSLPDALRAQIKQARRARGLSQAALGELVGLAQKHISAIENGHVVPRFDTLLDLVRTLDLDLVVVPRSLTPLVQSMVHQHGLDVGQGADRREFAPADERPLYALNDDAVDDDHLPGEVS